MTSTWSLMNDFQSVQSESEAWLVVAESIFIGMIITAFIFLIVIRKIKTYKQGQIDALNGKIHYELKRNEDGEEVWIEKEGGSNDKYK